mgnify:CR=1 FL=1
MPFSCDDDDWSMDIMSSVPIVGGTEDIEDMFGILTSDDDSSDDSSMSD